MFNDHNDHGANFMAGLLIIAVLLVPVTLLLTAPRFGLLLVLVAGLVYVMGWIANRFGFTDWFMRCAGLPGGGHDRQR